ncbi:MAG TPA: hypothetical protein ACHBX0_10905 [Arsenophonus sp.]
MDSGLNENKIIYNLLDIIKFFSGKCDVLPQIDMKIANNTSSLEQEKNDVFKQQLKKSISG